MLPLAENMGFWTFTVIACLIAYLFMRRHVRKQVVSAPRESLRSPRQRALARLSLLLVYGPLCYVSFINGDWFWAAFVILFVHAGLMLGLRLKGTSYQLRTWLLWPITVVSLLCGAVMSVWPSLGLDALRTAPWLFLALAAISTALGGLASIYSFPVGFGERAR